MMQWGYHSTPDLALYSPNSQRSSSISQYHNKDLGEDLSHLREEDFVKINVCGMIYETLEATLKRYPDTLLGDKEKRKKYFVPSKNAYYFDRNRESFEAILYYYQSARDQEGALLRPEKVPYQMFVKDVHFFGLGKKALSELRFREGYPADEAEPLMPSRSFQRTIWKLLEYPDSGIAARIYAIWSMFMIIFSIVIFCVETMPGYHEEPNLRIERTNTSNTSNSSIVTEPPEFTATDYFNYLELACVVWFTAEYLLRLIFSPDKLQFLKSILNLIDLLAVMPYFVIMAIHSQHSAPISVFRLVRLIRVFRIFKLSRHSMGLQILGDTLKASVNELGMLIFFLCFGVIIFSSAMFYVEHVMNNQFRSIPDTFWYAVVTMATVGYGDQCPITPLGKIIGSACALSGVLLVAMVVPVIVSNFEFFYKVRITNERLISEEDFFHGEETEV